VEGVLNTNAVKMHAIDVKRIQIATISDLSRINKAVMVKNRPSTVIIERISTTLIKA
jgi:glycine betaine/choline ABC-type transport system substrate-binding protein